MTIGSLPEEGRGRGGGGGGEWRDMECMRCVVNKRKEKAGKKEEKVLSQNWREKQVDLVVVLNPFSINGSNFT